MKCVEIMDGSYGVFEVNPETTAKVREALKDIQDSFESFWYPTSH